MVRDDSQLFDGRGIEALVDDRSLLSGVLDRHSCRTTSTCFQIRTEFEFDFRSSYVSN